MRARSKSVEPIHSPFRGFHDGILWNYTLNKDAQMIYSQSRDLYTSGLVAHLTSSSRLGSEKLRTDF